MRARLASVGAVLSLLAVSACAQILGLDPYPDSGGQGGSSSGNQGAGGQVISTSTTTGSDGSSSSGGTGGAVSCSPSTCYSDAPSGWAGPFALFEDAAPECPNSWTTSALGTLADPPASLTCSDCACVASADVCTIGVVLDEKEAAQGCTMSDTVPIVVDVGCAPLTPSQPDVEQVLPGGVTRNDGECEFGPSANCAVPSFDLARLCSPPSESPICESGSTCVPTNMPVCIAHTGVVACSAPYLTAHTFYTGYSVGGCTCTGAPAGVDCTPNSLSIASSSDCTDPISVSVTTCTTVTAMSVGSVDYSPGNPGTCSDAVAVEANKDDEHAVTVCCMP